MANPDIGDINCAWCGTESPVRKRKDGKLYVMCPSCGQQFLNGPGGQDVILERATIYGHSTVRTNKPDVCTNNTAPVREISPAEPTEPPENSHSDAPQGEQVKKKSWLEEFLEDDA